MEKVMTACQGRSGHRIRSALGLLCLLGAATVAPAQEAYVSVGAGRSNWDFSECGASGCDRSAGAWRLAAGYRLNRIVAAEAFHADLGRARATSPSLDGQLRARALGMQVLLGWLGSDAEIAGKIGLAQVRTDFSAAPTSVYPSASARHTELIGGLMGAYRLAPGMSIRIDVDIVTAALQSDAIYYSRGADVVTATIGLMFRF